MAHRALATAARTAWASEAGAYLSGIGRKPDGIRSARSEQTLRIPSLPTKPPVLTHVAGRRRDRLYFAPRRHPADIDNRRSDDRELTDGDRAFSRRWLLDAEPSRHLPSRFGRLGDCASDCASIARWAQPIPGDRAGRSPSAAAIAAQFAPPSPFRGAPGGVASWRTTRFSRSVARSHRSAGAVNTFAPSASRLASTSRRI